VDDGGEAVIRIAVIVFLAASFVRANKVTLDDNGVINIDGKKVFVISVSLPPMPGA
jgi:hypothetical protein